MPRTVLLTSALVGCAYQPGSFMHGSGPEAVFAGERVTVGCLDVAVARRLDHEAGAVLQYRFGNRCNRPVQVDLRSAAVIGRFADGKEVALAPYDPRFEMRPLRLDGRLSGGEAIAYPTPQPVTQICVDAATIAGAQPARWMCFATRDDVDHAEVAQHAAPAGEVAP